MRGRDAKTTAADCPSITIRGGVFSIETHATMIGNIVGWCIFGLIAGAIARLLTPGRDSLGCLGTIVVGVAGSFLCGSLAHLFFGSPGQEMQPAGFVGAIIGGILVILLMRRMAHRR